MTDLQLHTAWLRRGDAEAFNTIVHLHAGLVFAAALRILRNAADAEEVAQEAFLKLAGLNKPLRSSLAGWLHTTATRLALSRLRGDTRRRNREQQFAATQPVSTIETWDDFADHVDEAIAALPEALKTPILLHYFEGQRPAQIARQLNVSKSTITRRLQRGVEKIRIHLKRRNVIAASALLINLLGAHARIQAAPLPLLEQAARIALAGPDQLTVTGATASAFSLPALLSGITAATLITLGSVVFFQQNGTSEPAESSQTPAATATEPATPTVSYTPTPTTPPRQYNLDDLKQAVMRPFIRMNNWVVAKTARKVEIHGKVFSSEGEAIENAEVLVHWWAGVPGELEHETVRTDADGRYSIIQRRDLYYRDLEAHAPGYTFGEFRLSEPVTTPRIEANFILKPAQILKGYLFSPEGMPVTDAHIDLAGQVTEKGMGGTFSGRGKYTDAEGAFTISPYYPILERALFFVQSEAYGNNFFDVDALGGEFLEFHMQPTAALQGTIYTPDGTPAQNVEVTLSCRVFMTGLDSGVKAYLDHMSVYTDASGHYAFERISPDADLHLTVSDQHDGMYTRLCEEQCLPPLRPGETKQWNYTLPVGMRVSGTVYAGTTPISSQSITYSHNGSTPSHHQRDAFVWTNHTGEYSLSLFRPGRYIFFPGKRLGCSAENFFEVESEPITWVAGAEHTVDFHLPPVSKITVTVTDKAGIPLTNAEVSPNGYSVKRTNAHGQATINDLFPTDEQWVYANHFGYASNSTSITISEEQPEHHEIAIILYESSGVSGLVVDDTGLPLAHRTIMIKMNYPDSELRDQHWDEESVISKVIKTDAEGAFTIIEHFPALEGYCSIQYSHMDSMDTCIPLEEILDLPDPIQLVPHEITDLGIITIPAPHE